MSPEVPKSQRSITRSWHAIVPAAGVGRRLGHALPKQYLPLGKRSILQWTVDALCQAVWIHEILVVVAPDDLMAEAQMAGRPRVRVVRVGGETRRDSVRNALACLGRAARDDWILVQDAARPGITLELLDRLKLGVESDPVGGLLAIPVADTVKRHSPGVPGVMTKGATAQGATGSSGTPARSAQTIDRSALWLAQTPQVFRFGLLQDALDRCPEATDEASAIEALGHQPLLIPGARENFKVTTAEDYALMQRLLT